MTTEMGRGFPAFFHPSALILCCISMMISVQLMSLLMATSLCFILLGTPGVASRWLKLIRRNRFLLASLFIVISYGLPGDGLGGIDLFPSLNGILGGLSHTFRLMVLLGALAFLFAGSNTHRLLSGLWVLLSPLERIGIPIRSSTVRLGLVLSALDRDPFPLKDWRKTLTNPFQPIFRENTNETDMLTLEQPVWHRQDILLMTAAAGLLILASQTP